MRLRNFVLVFLLIMMNSTMVLAAIPQQETSELSAFGKNLYYDIYFNSGENCSSLIENVEILGTQEFGGKKYLIIQSKDFKLQEARGLVLLDFITAILPNGNFRVKEDDARKVPRR